MIGAMLSGSYSKSRGRQRTSNLMDTQKYGMESLWSQYLRPYFGTASKGGGGLAGARTGLGLPTYTGQLPGTYTPTTYSNLFRGAEARTTGEVTPASGLFGHYDYWKDPEKRVAETVAHQEALLAPYREQEDAELRARMKAMGLQYSTPALKAQADIEARREAERAVYADEVRQRAEEMGFAAGEAELQAIQGIAQKQYEIANAGLDAQFQEWLRTQPEYNPMIDTMLAYLGIKGKEETSYRGTGWTVSGKAQYSPGAGAGAA